MLTIGLLPGMIGPRILAQMPTFNEEERALIQQLRLGPLPPDPSNRVADNQDAFLLGRQFFYTTRFSGNGQTACATCHDPNKGFGDGRSLSQGAVTLPRHAPSLFNLAWQRWFFWDGRADSLWSQALVPLEAPAEMAGNRLAMAHWIARDPSWRLAYQALFGPLPDLADARRFPPAGKPMPEDPEHALNRTWLSMAPADQALINGVFVNIGKAIAAFERRLLAQASPFDHFAEGLARDDLSGQSAMSPQAQRGLKLFLGKARCRMCHTGPIFSDGEFHNTGVPPLAGGMPRDAGRFDGIGKLRAASFRLDSSFSDDRSGSGRISPERLVRDSSKWGQFKTPGLRNAALSPPYMHQGQLEDLAAVVHFYNTLDSQVFSGHHREPFLAPLGLNEEEEADLVAFLHALTGPVRPEWSMP